MVGPSSGELFLLTRKNSPKAPTLKPGVEEEVEEVDGEVVIPLGPPGLPGTVLGIITSLG